jgi:diguanylate cyclase (GGDEF)-like protein
LTGLANRRHFAEAFGSELARGARDGSSPALVLIDVDHFKYVNDAYGHDTGDAILVEVARRLGKAVRPYDCVARWGGEEFCIMLVDIADDDALAASADAIRRRIAERAFVVGDVTINLTCSVGAARPHPGGWSAEATLHDADRAVYAAKRAGRDCVRLATQVSAADAIRPESDQVGLARALGYGAAIREGSPPLHFEQVAELARRVATELGLSATLVRRCELGGFVHDVGKIAIPDAILAKPGKLTPDEWRVMRTHAALGEAIIRQTPGLRDVAPAVRHHHERYDGTGYPDHLTADEIPIEARIIAACDAYSAITSDRVYAAARPRAEAIDELRRSAGGHLDPAVVNALIRVLEDDQARTEHQLEARRGASGIGRAAA